MDVEERQIEEMCSKLREHSGPLAHHVAGNGELARLLLPRRDIQEKLAQGEITLSEAVEQANSRPD